MSPSRANGPEPPRTRAPRQAIYSRLTSKPGGPNFAPDAVTAMSFIERLILETLTEAYPDGLSKEEVAAKAGYEANGGGFNNALGRLRTLELVQGRGEIRASDNLFSPTPN
jgi:hypothetical protein